MGALPGDEEGTLYDRARRGDREAMGAVFQREQEGVLAVIRSQLHFPLRKLYDSWDVLQDIRAAVLKRDLRALFGSPGAFKAYLIRTARNRVAELYRSHAREKRDLQREAALDALPASAKEWLVDTATSDQVAVADEWADFMGSLSAAELHMLALSQRGFSTLEITTELGLADEEAKSLAFLVGSLEARLANKLRRQQAQATVQAPPPK